MTQRKYHINGKEIAISDVQFHEGRVSFSFAGNRYDFQTIALENGAFSLMEEAGRLTFCGFAAALGTQGAHIFIDGKGAFVTPVSGRKQGENTNNANGVYAPMPGKILAVHMKSGEEVEKSAPLVTMEAMKLQHALTSPKTGKIKAIHCSPGMQVKEGMLLVEME